MDKRQTTPKKALLKFLKWFFFATLILVALLAILNGFNMLDMQSKQIATMLTSFETGDIREVERLVKKHVIITHQVLFNAFVISVCSLVSIIIFLFITSHKTKKGRNKSS